MKKEDKGVRSPVALEKPSPWCGGEPTMPAQSHLVLAGMGRGDSLLPGRTQIEKMRAPVWG